MKLTWKSEPDKEGMWWMLWNLQDLESELVDVQITRHKSWQFSHLNEYEWRSVKRFPHTLWYGPVLAPPLPNKK